MKVQVMTMKMKMAMMMKMNLKYQVLMVTNNTSQLPIDSISVIWSLIKSRRMKKMLTSQG